MKKIALIAHDAKKDDMVLLVKSYQQQLKEFDLIATKGTGQLVMGRTSLPVSLLLEGPRGGDQQVGALIANGEVEAVIFLRDPLTAQPYEPDIISLLRVCEVHDIPLATNLSTAQAVFDMIFEWKTGSDEKDEKQRLLAMQAPLIADADQEGTVCSLRK